MDLLVLRVTQVSVDQAVTLVPLVLLVILELRVTQVILELQAT